MDMYNLRQIPSEAKIRQYLRWAIFGSWKLFCPECHHSNPVVYENRFRCRRCRPAATRRHVAHEVPQLPTTPVTWILDA